MAAGKSWSVYKKPGPAQKYSSPIVHVDQGFPKHLLDAITEAAKAAGMPRVEFITRKMAGVLGVKL